MTSKGVFNNSIFFNEPRHKDSQNTLDNHNKAQKSTLTPKNHFSDNKFGDFDEDYLLSNDLMQKLEESSPVKSVKDDKSCQGDLLTLETCQMDDSDRSFHSESDSVGPLPEKNNLEQLKALGLRSQAHKSKSTGSIISLKDNKFSFDPNTGRIVNKLVERRENQIQDRMNNNQGNLGNFSASSANMLNMNAMPSINPPPQFMSSYLIPNISNYMSPNFNGQTGQVSASSRNTVELTYPTDPPSTNLTVMYGKTGWVCHFCKNFNYETRRKCNRCSRPPLSKPEPMNSTLKNPNLSNPFPFSQASTIQPPKLSPTQTTASNSRIDVPPVRTTTTATTSKEELVINNNNSNSNSNANSDEKKKKKPFQERAGDWVCIKCKNLNFSFRSSCNRCQLPKMESQKLFEEYMKNLMNHIKYNEMLQNQILSTNSIPTTSDSKSSSATTPNIQVNNQYNINLFTPQSYSSTSVENVKKSYSSNSNTNDSN